MRLRAHGFAGKLGARLPPPKSRPGLIVMQTLLSSEQEAQVLALSPDDRARFDEIAAFVEFEQGNIAINAERAAYGLVFGENDDPRGYHYPDVTADISRHRPTQ